MKYAYLHFNLKLITYLFIVILLVGCYTSKQRQLPSNHTLITPKNGAIIPFEVQRLPNEATAEVILQLQQNDGYGVQKDVYHFILQEQDKGKYPLTLQDITKTNFLLREAGITYQQLRTLPKQEIASILGVDAVILGKIKIDWPLYTEVHNIAQEAVRILTGIRGKYRYNLFSGTIIMYEANGDKQTWRYSQEIPSAFGVNRHAMLETFIKNASRTFPYKHQ